jgi:hypothetical protein
MRSETKRKKETMDKDKLKEIHNKRFLDKNFQEVKFENQNNLQFFLSKEERNGKSWVVGKCFTNKSFNHRWFYRFKDEDGFNKQCLKTIDDNNSWKAKNEEYKQEQQKPHTLKVGDILSCSWGYDQTQVDFFKVSQILGKKKIKIVGLGTSLESDGYHDKATPFAEGGNHWTKKQYFCDVDKKYKNKNVELVKLARSNNSVKISSFAYAYLWDGQAKYSTNSMGGH